MSWITTVSPEDAQGELAELYDRVAGADGQVDQVLQVHSLRPHTLEGHMALYRNVLHHRGNRLPGWFLEAIGVFVSRLNGCDYCVRHHREGMRRAIDDEERFRVVDEALSQDRWRDAFDDHQQAMLAYARALALRPDHIRRIVIEDMHEEGVDDGEILEVNQVTAYFCYVNRVVLGLGVEIEDEQIGLSPSGDGWEHR